jgi:hypothetical protein
MWFIFVTFVSGMLVKYRLRYHGDPEKLRDPENTKRFIKRIELPPKELLTERGLRLRGFVYELWTVPLLGFIILVLWR